MSLLVRAYTRGPGGEMLFVDGPPGTEQAGPEAARTELYASASAISLGARMLPLLATENIYAETPAELDALEADCTLLLRNATQLSHATGQDPDKITTHLANIAAAIARARSHTDGAVVIW